jgi:hypothetical protein
MTKSIALTELQRNPRTPVTLRCTGVFGPSTVSDSDIIIPVVSHLIA